MKFSDEAKRYAGSIKAKMVDIWNFIKARRWLQILLIVILALLVIGAGCVLAYNQVMNSNLLTDKENTGSDDGILDEEIATTPEEKEQFMNVLLCGIDYKKNTGRAKLTDVMMVVHMDFVNKTVDILQLPRDTYIGPEYPTGKLNAVYGASQNGGIENVARKINQMLNVPLDYYVMMDMNGFEDIVDSIGGVMVDSPYSFTLEGVTIVEGVQTLDGRAASKFVRERHSYAAGDLTRMKMQQIFMKAFMEKCLSLGNTEILKLAPTIFEYLSTDMTFQQALDLYNIFSDIRLDAVEFHSCDVTGFYDPYDRLAKLSIHAKPLADVLNEHFRENGETVNWTELGILEYVTDYPYEGEQSQYQKEDGTTSSVPAMTSSSSSSRPASSTPSSRPSYSSQVSSHTSSASQSSGGVTSSEESSSETSSELSSNASSEESTSSAISSEESTSSEVSSEESSSSAISSEESTSSGISNEESSSSESISSQKTSSEDASVPPTSKSISKLVLKKFSAINDTVSEAA